MTNVQKLHEALKPGSTTTFTVDETGGLHIGAVSRPADPETRLRAQESAVKLEEAERRATEEVFSGLCGGAKVDFSGYRRGRS